jgi:hypothetical protein
MKTWPTIPEWMQDFRKKLPWNDPKDPRFAEEAARRTAKGLPARLSTEPRTWGKRTPDQIRGVCVHQTDGGSKVENTNAYHIGPNHISWLGCPHICYTLHIDPEGVVKICNDFADVTWSQATDSQPGSENVFFLAVVLGGKFRNQFATKLPDPSQDAMEALQRLWMWAQDAFELTSADLYGHFDFGKAGCPGTAAEQWIRESRSDSGLLVEAGVSDWQRALVDLGYILGASGPKKDGVDGDWGGKSRRALLQFQQDHNLQATGSFDRPTAWMLRQVTEQKITASMCGPVEPA